MLDSSSLDTSNPDDKDSSKLDLTGSIQRGCDANESESYSRSDQFLNEISFFIRLQVRLLV
jgi:hypothetical protein